MISDQHEHMGTDSIKVHWKNLRGLEGFAYAQGDIFYIDANNNLQLLSPGTTGQFLKTQGVGANPTWSAMGKFGGTGSDGVLSISSGTTTIDCAGATYLVKNYISISITGTGKLAFSNPHANGTVIIIKSKGDVTLTSSTAPMIDVSGMGAGGGSGQAGGSGDNGTTATETQDGSPHNGVGGTYGAPGTGGAGGSAWTNLALYTSVASRVYKKCIVLGVGSGGAGGGGGWNGGTVPGANGGNGGGSLYIECGGAWNFTTANGISANGNNGLNASGTASHGGGGAGSGGSVIVLYNSLTANSGTITVAGGSGGSGGAWQGVDSGGGGGGAGGYSGGGTSGGNPVTNVRGGNGGAGANGFSLVAQNTEFV